MSNTIVNLGRVKGSGWQVSTQTATAALFGFSVSALSPGGVLTGDFVVDAAGSVFLVTAVENGTATADAEALGYLSLKGDAADLPTASALVAGVIKIGSGLKIDAGGTASVDTVSAVTQNSTKPITSGAVYAAIGNVESLLAAI